MCWRRSQSPPHRVFGARSTPIQIHAASAAANKIDGTSIFWETHGVDHAKVFVTAEGRHQQTEKLFSESANCEPGRCRAPWITPGTRYIFTLVDFTRGNRGRVLGNILVRGDDRYSDPPLAIHMPAEECVHRHFVLLRQIVR